MSLRNTESKQKLVQHSLPGLKLKHLTTVSALALGLGCNLPAFAADLAADRGAEASAAEAEAAQPATTQPRAATPETEVSEVVVSASRIVRDGYSSPTPVTVVGAEDLAVAGKPTVFQALWDMPAMASNRGTNNYSTGQSFTYLGMTSFNLRGIGLERTLMLIDGQRIVPALLNGNANASEIPEGLVKRVDIVTGGASASWGSDAVAGVVNYVMDNTFTGVKAHIYGGITKYGDDEQGGAELTGGTAFAGGRGHIVASGEFYKNAGVPRGMSGRKWHTATRLLQRTIAGTPAGQPQLLRRDYVYSTLLAPGGIITGGPLRGIAFGPGGTPYNFIYGSPEISNYSVGGESTGDMGINPNLDATLERGTVYSRASYDLTDSINVFASVSFGYADTSAHSFPGQYRPGTLTIRCDNAFLPATITAACAANNITSFAFGTFTADVPDTVTAQHRTMQRYVVGGEGRFAAFGKDWTWSTHFQHGKTFGRMALRNASLTPHFLLAIDAVNGPNGQIVCRSTLTNPTNGCVPFNPIGTGVVSPSAIDWVTGEAWLETWIRQEAFSFSLNGEPFSSWAGPISVATGYEYRQEAFHQSADAYSEGNGGNPLLNPLGNNWFTGNYHAARGKFDVHEAFLETVIPLVHDDAIGIADLSLAGRATDYSTSGFVATWKAGLNYAPGFVEGLRFRTMISRDIRAPNLENSFSAPSSYTGVITERQGPFTGQQFSVQHPTSGNPNLKPEKGITKQFGVVYQPAWAPGLSGSIDWWRISVKDSIGAIGAQSIVDMCALGNQDICRQILRDGAGRPTQVNLAPINLAQKLVEGIDFEATYRTALDELIPWASGNLTIRALGTHTMRHVDTPGLPNSIPMERAGVNASGGVPTWKWNFTQVYDNDRIRLSLTERWFSDGVNSNEYIECQTNCPAPTLLNPTIDDNHVKGGFYVDLGGSYKFGGDEKDAEAYIQIDNLLDKDPAIVPSLASGLSYIGRAVNASLYPTLGRTYRAGVRIKF